jgi:hypothetical protein
MMSWRQKKEEGEEVEYVGNAWGDVDGGLRK